MSRVTAIVRALPAVFVASLPQRRGPIMQAAVPIASVADARHQVLVRLGSDHPRLDAATAITSQLVATALRLPTPDADDDGPTLSVTAAPRGVRVAVSTDARIGPLVSVDGEPVDGRQLVGRLATRWGYARDEHQRGTTWCEIGEER